MPDGPWRADAASRTLPAMTRTETMRTAEAPAALLAEVRRLLEAAFEDGFPQEDWDHTVGGWHVVVLDGDAVVAHAAVVTRTLEVDGRPHRTGYVEGVATAPDRQGQGLGSRAMTALADVLRREHDLGALSTGEHRFYERLGWERWRGPTFVRDHGTLIRTEDEDDGIMVLRFGLTRELDLRAAISCEARPGDDW